MKSTGGADWWGLFAAGDTVELRSVVVSMTRDHDPIVDAEGETTGIVVTINTADVPLMLFKGLPRARPGRLPTALMNAKLPLPDESVTLQSQASESLRTTGGRLAGFGRMEPLPNEVVISDYRLVLYENAESDKGQTLLEQDRLEFEGSPGVIWAGDLDGDNKLDLLLDLTWHYNVTVPTLFLSTFAKPGELVGLAGQLTLTGC